MKPITIVRPRFPRLGVFSYAFSECLDSGAVTNDGQYVRRFETELSNHLMARTAVFCNGHAALLAMLVAINVAGKRVILPSFTFASTAHAVVMAGGVPVFADIDPGTLCLDPSDVQSKITENTGAILGVDVYGICCDYAGLGAISMERGIPFLMDSAPSFGSYSVVKALDFCDAQMFSFHATKQFSTMEGGCVVTQSSSLIERVKRIRNFGQGMDGDCDLIGLNGKMMEVCALIGLHELPNISWTSVARSDVVAKLRASLYSIPGVSFPAYPLSDQVPNWLYLPVFIDEPKFGMSRDDVAIALRKFDVHVRKYYTACHRLTCYKSYAGCDLPVTDRMASNILAFPVYPDMTDSEIHQIAEAMRCLSEGRGY